MRHNTDSETKRDGPKTERAVRDRLIGLAFVVALAFFLASMMPSALVAPVFSNLLFFAALGGIASALLRRQSPFGTRELTGWDQAALLLFASLLAGFFVDPQAARETLAQINDASGAAS